MFMKIVDLLHEDYLFGVREFNLKYTFTTGCGKGVRFRCSSDSVSVRIKLKSLLPVKQTIGASLTNGILYRVSDIKEEKVLMQNCFVNRELCAEYKLFSGVDGLYEIFFPIVNTIVEAMVIISDDAEIVPVLYSDKRIVWCGGARLYGVGCTAANTICSNIIQSALKLDTINLSVWKNLFLESQLGECIKEYRPHVIVMECSCKGMSLEYLKNNLEIFLFNIIESNENTPIYILSEDDWYMHDEKRERKIYVSKVIKQIKNKVNVSSLFYIDVQDIFADDDLDMYTFSSNYINDYANIKIAKYLMSHIKTAIFEGK